MNRLKQITIFVGLLMAIAASIWLGHSWASYFCPGELHESALWVMGIFIALMMDCLVLIAVILCWHVAGAIIKELQSE